MDDVFEFRKRDTSEMDNFIGIQNREYNRDQVLRTTRGLPDSHYGKCTKLDTQSMHFARVIKLQNSGYSGHHDTAGTVGEILTWTRPAQDTEDGVHAWLNMMNHLLGFSPVPHNVISNNTFYEMLTRYGADLTSRCYAKAHNLQFDERKRMYSRMLHDKHVSIRHATHINLPPQFMFKYFPHGPADTRYINGHITKLRRAKYFTALSYDEYLAIDSTRLYVSQRLHKLLALRDLHKSN